MTENNAQRESFDRNHCTERVCYQMTMHRKSLEFDDGGLCTE